MFSKQPDLSKNKGLLDEKMLKHGEGPSIAEEIAMENEAGVLPRLNVPRASLPAAPTMPSKEK